MPCSPSSASSLPFGNGLAASGGYDPHAPGRHVQVRFQLRGINDRHHEVPSFSLDLALNALLALLGQDLAGRERVTILGDDDQVLARRHVHEERVPHGQHHNQADHEQYAPHDQPATPIAERHAITKRIKCLAHRVSSRRGVRCRVSGVRCRFIQCRVRAVDAQIAVARSPPLRAGPAAALA